MVRPEDLETLPIETVNPLVNLMIRDVATVRQGMRPGEYDRDMSQRYLTLTANVEGEDMGRASRHVAQAIEAAGDAARGCPGRALGPAPADDRDVPVAGHRPGRRRVCDLRALDRLFPVAAAGLDLDRAVPGVLAGIATILYLTDTSLNIESFMGSIMCLGVSVSNSVMLVTFIDEHWKEDQAVGRGRHRRCERAVPSDLDDRLAMTVGMVPMALALERGSQMQAPLGLAVIGGLVMSTFATLLVVPSIFAVVIGASSPLAIDLSGRPRERRTSIRQPSRADDKSDERNRGQRAEATRGRRLSETYGRPRFIRRPTRRRRMPPSPGRTLMRRTLRRHDFGSSPAGRRLAHILAPGRLWVRRAAAASTRPITPASRAPDRGYPSSVRHIVRVVGQPSFIESYERTSIYPKLTAYIEKWIVDIGDKVKRGTCSPGSSCRSWSRISGPRRQRSSSIRNGSSWPTSWWRWPMPTLRRPGRASKRPGRFWPSSRLRSTAGIPRSAGRTGGERGVVDPQVLLESINQLKSSTAARDAAKATIMKAEAELLSEKPTWPEPRSTSRLLGLTSRSPRARRGGSRPGSAISC